MNHKALSLPMIFTAALVLVLLGHWFTLQRSLNPSASYLAIRGDSVAYIEMIEGKWRTMRLPFRYRILVPALARALPLSAEKALQTISYLSLFLCYIIILLVCRRWGLDALASLLGLGAVFTSTWHLFNYHNPFLVDCFALLMVCGMIYALISDSFIMFTVCAVVGVLSRETVMVIVPIWALTKDRRRGLLVLALALLAFGLPRYLMSAAAMPYKEAFTQAVEANMSGHKAQEYIPAVVWAWAFSGCCWLWGWDCCRGSTF